MKSHAQKAKIREMPRPEYRKPDKKTIYAEVDQAIKGMLADICYRLDAPEYKALEEVIRYYYERERIKPRPSRRA